MGGYYERYINIVCGIESQLSGRNISAVFYPLFLIYVFLCVRIFFLKERFFWCVSEKQAVSTDTSIIAFGGGLECWFPMCWKAMT